MWIILRILQLRVLLVAVVIVWLCLASVRLVRIETERKKRLQKKQTSGKKSQQPGPSPKVLLCALLSRRFGEYFSSGNTTTEAGAEC